MGLYDRDYSRQTEPGFYLAPPRTATTQLVIVTVGVYVVQLLLPWLGEHFALEADWFHRPWQFYQLLTYGFLHDPHQIEHIFVNMLVLWFFGREIEQRYGRAEFLTFFLVAIAFAGAVWSLSETGMGSNAVLIGASGGITAIFALYAFNFPHRQVLFFFIIPMPMWLAASIAVAWDAKGAIARSGNVAFTAHLAGALFALCYYWFGWSLSGGIASRLGGLSVRPKPRLRVHEPEEPEEEDDLSRKVDDILQKIQEQGQDSLTWNERRLLEKASRRYQQRRH